MKINGKITLFPERRVVDESTKEERVFLKGSLSSKEKDSDNYIHKSVEVILAPERFPLEKVNKLETKLCYTLEVKDGFIGVKGWTTKDGKQVRDIYLVVLDGKLIDSKEYKAPVKEPEADNGLPF